MRNRLKTGPDYYPFHEFRTRPPPLANAEAPSAARAAAPTGCRKTDIPAAIKTRRCGERQRRCAPDYNRRCHPEKTVRQALDCRKEGMSASSISRAMGINCVAARAWIKKVREAMNIMEMDREKRNPSAVGIGVGAAPGWSDMNTVASGRRVERGHEFCRNRDLRDYRIFRILTARERRIPHPRIALKARLGL